MAEMSADERAELARRVRERRIEVYATKIAAYRAAELNSATWDNLESGRPVRHDRLIAAVKTLWPESGGDWRRIDAEANPAIDRLSAVEAAVADLRRRIEAIERGGSDARGAAAGEKTAGEGEPRDQGGGEVVELRQPEPPVVQQAAAHRPTWVNPSTGKREAYPPALARPPHENPLGWQAEAGEENQDPEEG